MKTLKLADGLSVPLEIVTEKVAWLGRTGSGKTYGAMKLAELMLEAGAQIGVLDPVGVWRALRVPSDKDGRAFEVVVFGGLYGDVPLEPGAGKLIADLVVDRGLSFVLDVSQFIPSEQQTFAAAFAHQFFHRKKSSPSAVHLFMEECQEFIPENPSGREALTLGEFQRLWKLGRNFGIGGSLISQRPQEIAKKALNMSGTMFAFQMTGPQERKAVRAWVADQGIATDIEAVLQKLRTGEPHVESPTFLAVSKTVRILPRVTADLSSTPKVGGSAVAKRPLTPIDVETLRTQMAATIERAKADDPKELRKELASVRQQLQQAQRVGPSSQQASTPGKSTPALTDKDREIIGQLITGLTETRDALNAGRQRIIEEVGRKVSAALNVATIDMMKLLEQAEGQAERGFALKKVEAVLDKLAKVPAPASINGRAYTAPVGIRGNAPVSERPIQKPQQNARTVQKSEYHDGGTPIGKVHRAFLTVLANRQGKSTSRNQLAVFSGYSAKSRHVDNTISACRTAGWLDGSSNALRITDAGLAALGPFDALPSGDDLRAYWIREAGAAPGAMLKALADVYPRTLSRDEVAEASNYSVQSRHVDNSLSYLRTLELIEGDRSALRASEELFG